MKKIIRFIIVTYIGLLSLSCQNLLAASLQQKELTPNEKKQIENVIHDYLLQHPEILMEVGKKLQEQQLQTMEQKARSAILANTKLFFNSQAPVAGNPKGKITLIEFFDYQCSHCKKMSVTINNLAKANPDLKVIYRVLPIFQNSDFIAEAALAAEKQGKYAAFHQALFNANNLKDQANILSIAKTVGLNTNQLTTDMRSAAVKKSIDDNIAMAQKMGLMVTPIFIVAANIDNPKTIKIAFLPGEVSQQALQQAIKQVK